MKAEYLVVRMALMYLKVLVMVEMKAGYLVVRRVG